jgi:hypothetical protein
VETKPAYPAQKVGRPVTAGKLELPFKCPTHLREARLSGQAKNQKTPWRIR